MKLSALFLALTTSLCLAAPSIHPLSLSGSTDSHQIQLPVLKRSLSRTLDTRTRVIIERTLDRFIPGRLEKDWANLKTQLDTLYPPIKDKVSDLQNQIEKVLENSQIDLTKPRNRIVFYRVLSRHDQSQGDIARLLEPRTGKEEVLRQLMREGNEKYREFKKLHAPFSKLVREKLNRNLLKRVKPDSEMEIEMMDYFVEAGRVFPGQPGLDPTFWSVRD